MTTTGCDLEQCERCGQSTVEGNDAAGLCPVCSGPTTLDALLRSMAAGVTRDRKTGRFTSTRKA